MGCGLCVGVVWVTPPEVRDCAAGIRVEKSYAPDERAWEQHSPRMAAPTILTRRGRISLCQDTTTKHIYLLFHTRVSLLGPNRGVLNYFRCLGWEARAG